MLSVALFAQLEENCTGFGQTPEFFFRSWVQNYDELLICLTVFEMIEYFFQLTGRVLLVHRDPIFCIDND